jgi:hypothetical protein
VDERFGDVVDDVHSSGAAPVDDVLADSGDPAASAALGLILIGVQEFRGMPVQSGRPGWGRSPVSATTCPDP